MPNDTASKVQVVLAQVEALLNQEAQSQAGVDPMMVLVAGILPMFKAGIREAAADPDRFDRGFDLFAAAVLALRGDDRPGLLALPPGPDGAPRIFALGAHPDGFLEAGGPLQVEDRIGVPNISDWLHQLR